MMKQFSVVVVLVLFPFLLRAQELYIYSEPASTLPKNVLGVRLFGYSYEELKEQRNLAALKLMYGVTHNITITAMGTVSNHHDKMLPSNLITHTHEGTQTFYQTNEFQRGLNYPYQFNGVSIGAKYRFFSRDAQNEHFRMALTGEGSYIQTAHDEAEPTLMDDTKGYSVGWIGTYLYRHFAVSLHTGLILPGSYKETAPDFFGGDLRTKIEYGRAAYYNLSAGYLLYPSKYKSYSDVNINIYAEFVGKSYEAATITQNGDNVVPQTDLLKKGQYIDVYPGIQAIIQSNLRIDASVGLPLFGKSYVRFYPVFMFGIQRYFFL